MTFQRYLLHVFEHEPKENLAKLFIGFTPRQKETARILYAEWKRKKKSP